MEHKSSRRNRKLSKNHKNQSQHRIYRTLFLDQSEKSPDYGLLKRRLAGNCIRPSFLSLLSFFFCWGGEGEGEGGLIAGYRPPGSDVDKFF